jgi:Mor family transcriptional regulator
MNANADMFEAAPTHAELADIDAPDKRWPRMLAEYIDVLLATYRRLGASEDQALEYAEQGVLAIGKYCGGRQSYLPTGERLETAVRDRRIYLEYNGRNKGELAQRYDLTERRIEQIAAEQRAIHIRRIQPELFPR